MFFDKFKELKNKIKNKELKKYLLWKLGINTLTHSLEVFFNYILNPLQTIYYIYLYAVLNFSSIKNPLKYLNIKFNILVKTESDINQHLQVLSNYAEKCESIFETGVRGVISSWALLKGLNSSKSESKYFLMNDIEECDVSEINQISSKLGVKIEWIWKNNLDLDLNRKFDLIFIDTWHVYGQLKRELEKFSLISKKYIILHDTTLDGVIGETTRNGWDARKQSIESGYTVEEIKKGLWPAVVEFLENNSDWVLLEKFTHNNGLTILGRKEVSR